MTSFALRDLTFSLFESKTWFPIPTPKSPVANVKQKSSCAICPLAVNLIEDKVKLSNFKAQHLCVGNERL